jgi:hypothetical protein
MQSEKALGVTHARSLQGMRDGDRVRLFSRRGLDWTHSVPSFKKRRL